MRHLMTSGRHDERGQATAEYALLTGAIDRIRQAGRAAGKNMWMIGDGPSLTKKGFSFLCLTEPVMFLAASLGQLVQRTRENGPASSAPSQPLP